MVALAIKPLMAKLAFPFVLLLIFLMLEWVSFLHEHKGVPVTPWNPGLGVIFAVLVIAGSAYALVLFVGVVLAELFVLRTELPLPLIILMAAIVSATFAGASALARGVLALDARLRQVRDILILLSVGGVAAILSGGLLSLLLIAAANELSFNDMMQSTVPLILGDVIGIAVMTPLVLRMWVRWPQTTIRSPVQHLPEFAAYLLMIGFTLWVIVGADSPNANKFLSLLFLPVVAAAVRHGIDGSCISLAATQLGLVGTLRWHGYDAPAFTEFQVVMLVLTTSGLLVGVIVTDRERVAISAREAEERIRDLRAEAARAARVNMISGMASALAHEINQPMTAARALARSVQQLLRAPTTDFDRADKNLSNLVAQIDHAGGVVNRMREFLRRGRPRFSTLDIRPVLEDALVLVRPEAAEKGTSIILDLDEALPPIFGDRVQLQQVVLNLVRNALDAIGEADRTDGKIRIRAKSSNSMSGIEISIVDNGVGVSTAQSPFEPLTSTKYDGLGLGLSISASIVQAHGGRIWLQSSAPGQTDFRVSLPSQDQGAS